ncbi:DUF202 domain-containing protein [Nocardia mangyaensis]|uniref:DUF202 domain-containing protein n=1 Tax=Nocardia mangyaensis TaxID=2213200 RepID=UPI00267531F9|nr:DUF202 domain-containing protein [Nocardia mangyaensis]MDO3647816.1 DUF202 domain-containing protein [Nocardia mangyaensis]
MTGIGDADTGLAAERTALAWRRTAATAFVVSALLGHHVLVAGPVAFGDGGSAWHRVTSALALGGAAVMLLGISVLGWQRNHALRRGDRRVATAPVAGVALVVVAVAVMTLLSVPLADAAPRPDDRTVGLPGHSARENPLGSWEARIWREHVTPNRQGRPGGPESSRRP